MQLDRSRTVLASFLGLLALPGALLLGALPAGAATSNSSHAVSATDTSDFEFRSFDADYTLTKNPDGTSQLAVIETIVAVFPDFDQNRGIIRAIPNYYRLIPLNTQVQSIVDERGEPVPFETYASGEFIELWLGDDSFVYGATTYVIRYTQTNIVGAFSDTANDEFYWDVNGTGWDQSFGSVSATVHIASDLVPALTGETACYAGQLNGTTPCASLVQEVDPATASTTFTATQGALNPYETLTVAIGFAADTFVQGVAVSPEDYPGALPEEVVVLEDAPWWSNILSGLTLVAGAIISGIAIVRRVRGNDPKGRGVIIPQYSVPADLNVMVAAELVGRQKTAVPAQLVSLAVRHNIRILDYAVTEGSDADYTLQFISDSDTDAIEKKILRALFGKNPDSGDVRELSDADTALGTAVAAVQAEVRGAVWSEGFRARASFTPVVYLVVAFLILGATFVGTVALAAAFSPSGWQFLAIAGAVVTVVVTFATIKTDRLTDKGVEAREYLEGMKMYLELAEKERFRYLQSPETAERVDIGDTTQIIKLYEKLLPFAVIWGVEDQWMQELEVKVSAEGVTPDWFVSTDGFSTYAFTNALRGVATAATYTPPATTSWSSGGSSNSSFGSSFGGSSGGGFSGGGGGGGGGGGR